MEPLAPSTVLKTNNLINTMDRSRYYTTPQEPSYPTWSSNQYIGTAEGLMERCIDHYQRHAPRRSFGTLYCGALGPLVYLRLRMAQHMYRPNKPYAEKLLQEALAVTNEALQLEEQEGHRHLRVSLLEGPWVGAKALKSAILYQMNKVEQARDQATELLSVLRENCRQLPASECEVLYGRAGDIQAILFLREQLKDNSLGRSLAVTLASDIVSEGLTCSQRDDCSLTMAWKWHDTEYLGAAHGVIGILHTLLHLQPDELDSLLVPGDARQLIRQTISDLNEFVWPRTGNLKSSVDSQSDKLVHWCHGAPGHVMLLTKAFTALPTVSGGMNRSYLSSVDDITTNVIMKRGLLRKGVGLCHGISGNAYALLSIGRIGDKSIWIDKARFFSHFALDHLDELETVPDRPFSLYEGLGGLACLLLDLAAPEQSAFPLYEFA